MAGFLYKGILLQQFKEPALSRDLREFLNADTMGLRMERTPVEDPEALTHREIIEIARAASIVDERDGTLLADKLERARRQNCTLLIGDAIDDEPYISSQLNPMLKHPQLASDGLRFCMRGAGCKDAYFAVYKNLADLEARIPRKIGVYDVERIRGRYPAEYQAAQAYSEEDGVTMVGVGAVIHLARAILFNKPQTTTFITVAGNCIGNPTNLEVSLGMTVTQTLERCGLIDDPNRVVIGGSMTGISVIDTDNTLVTPTTRAILAFRQDVRSLRLSCIGCGRCVSVCPEGLNPHLLYRSIHEGRYDLFRTLDSHQCIGCGTCSYMCPARLDLSHDIREASLKFAHITESIEAQYEVFAEYKATDYDNFLKDFQFGKAIIAHRKNGLRLRRTFSALKHQALAEHNRQTHEADAQLEQARRTLAASEREADHNLTAAQHTMEQSHRQANQMEADAVKSRNQAHRDADRALLAAERAQEAAERAADKLLIEMERQQEKMEFSAVHDAQKELAAAEKAAEKGDNPPTPEQLRQLQANVESVRAQAAERRRQASIYAHQSREASKTDARATYNRAVQLCQRSKDSADQSVMAAQQTAMQDKQAADQQYAQAQTDHALAKAAALEIFRVAEQLHAQTLPVLAQHYSTTLTQIENDCYAKQADLDRILRASRDQMLLSAQTAAHARAVACGRTADVRDLTLTRKLFLCERELLLGAHRVEPPETLAALPTGQELEQAVEENTRKALLLLSLPSHRRAYQKGGVHS